MCTTTFLQSKAGKRAELQNAKREGAGTAFYLANLIISMKRGVMFLHNPDHQVMVASYDPTIIIFLSELINSALR